MIQPIDINFVSNLLTFSSFFDIITYKERRNYIHFMFYLPKTLYSNLQTLAKENNVSVSKQIIICLEYTNSHAQEYQEQIKKYPKNLYTEEQLKYIDTVHFAERFTTPSLKSYKKNHIKSYLSKHQPIEVVNRLNYGQHYKEIEERRKLCQKYKLTYQKMSTKN